MRKLIAFAVVAAGAAALITIPAAAKPPTGNGRIVFTRFDPVQGDDFVYTANPDGSQEQQLLPTRAEGPRWSPDGSRIVVFPHDVDGVSARIVNPDDGTYRDVANPGTDQFSINFECGNWSPQGNEILFSAHVPSDQRSTVWSVDSDGTGLRQIPI